MSNPNPLNEKQLNQTNATLQRKLDENKRLITVLTKELKELAVPDTKSSNSVTTMVSLLSEDDLEMDELRNDVDPLKLVQELIDQYQVENEEYKKSAEIQLIEEIGRLNSVLLYLKNTSDSEFNKEEIGNHYKIPGEQENIGFETLMDSLGGEYDLTQEEDSYKFPETDIEALNDLGNWFTKTARTINAQVFDSEAYNKRQKESLSSRISSQLKILGKDLEKPTLQHPKLTRLIQLQNSLVSASKETNDLEMQLQENKRILESSSSHSSSTESAANATEAAELDPVKDTSKERCMILIAQIEEKRIGGDKDRLLTSFCSDQRSNLNKTINFITMEKDLLETLSLVSSTQVTAVQKAINKLRDPNVFRWVKEGASAKADAIESALCNVPIKDRANFMSNSKCIAGQKVAEELAKHRKSDEVGNVYGSSSDGKLSLKDAAQSYKDTMKEITRVEGEVEKANYHHK
ncbi:MAG: hypothetical protein WC627_04605 [Legionella sp.]